MLPILIDFKVIKIYTFGVFLVLGFFWGCFLLWKMIRLTSNKEDEIFDGVFWSLSGGLFLGRLFYVVCNFNKFGFDPLKFILINGYPGLSLYGLIIGSFLTLYFYCSYKKIKFIEIIDYFICPVFAALGFGKLGSFFSGDEKLIPLLEAILFFLASFISYKILMAIRKEKFKSGFNFSFFWLYFALAILLFDKLKVNHLYLLGLNLNSTISLLLVLTFSFYFLYYFRSLIINRLKEISILFLTYGQKIVKKIYSRAASILKRGKKKDNAPDQRTEDK